MELALVGLEGAEDLRADNAGERVDNGRVVVVLGEVTLTDAVGAGSVPIVELRCTRSPAATTALRS